MSASAVLLRLCLLVLPAAFGCAGPAARPELAATVNARAADVPTPWHTCGESVEGRPIRLRSVGLGPVRVLWVGGIHGDEIEGMVATAELPAALATRPGLAEQITLSILEDVNPDGRVHGTRGNVHGVDLNRNYPATNYRPGGGRGEAALSEPESRALFELLDDLQPDLVMVAHSQSRRGAGINWDGPAEAFAEVWAANSSWPLQPSSTMHSTPGSLGTLVGIDRGKPILTMEWARGTDPQTAWVETRPAILAVLAAAGERAGGGSL